MQADAAAPRKAYVRRTSLENGRITLCHNMFSKLKKVWKKTATGLCVPVRAPKPPSGPPSQETWKLPGSTRVAPPDSQLRSPSPPGCHARFLRVRRSRIPRFL